MIRFENIHETVQSPPPDADLEILRKAYIFSAVEHKGQLRSSGEPYLVHPLGVAMILAEQKLDEVSVATGLLHDVLEDTPTTKEQLAALFGSEVARGRRRRHEDRPLRLHLEGGPAGRDVPQDAPGDDGGHPGHPREARRPPPQHADALPPPEEKRRASRPRRWRSTPRSPTASAWGSSRTSSRTWRSGTSTRRSYETLSPAVDERMKASAAASSRRSGPRSPPPSGGRHPGRGRAAASSGSGRSARSSRQASIPSTRSTTSSRSGSSSTRSATATRARHRPPGLAAGARPHQGLHRDAEAEFLPVAPHLGDPDGGAPLRGPDPDPRHGPDRRARDRGALEVQGRPREPPGRRAGDRLRCASSWRRPRTSRTPASS
jgi:hypothetical protein